MLMIARMEMSLGTLLVLLLACVPLYAAPPSGGGGGSKVTVTEAFPPDAFQGQELDVIVSGSGFDAGSQVSYLVTGTTDASQVDVLSVQYISSTELKTRIRPKDAALPTEYDIQVQTSSGRKGKGTTLFRVKVAETACTGDEPKEPEIVYLTGLDNFADAGIYTQDMYLSSASGCDQYLLLSGAVQVHWAGNGSDPEAGLEYLADVQSLHLDVDGNQGVVVWADTSMQIAPLMAMRFSVDADGAITSDALGPQVVYWPPNGYRVYSADVHVNEFGAMEVAVVERAADNSEWRLAHVNLDTGVRSSLAEGTCPFQDVAGECYQPMHSVPWWNVDGTQIYLTSHSWIGADPIHMVVVRVKRIAGVWQPAQTLMKNNDAHIAVIGLRPNGLLSYEFRSITSTTKGRKTSVESQILTATIDPEDCVAFECLPADGEQMAADASKFPRGFTRDGGMLFVETVNSNRNLRNYADPVSGTVGALNIVDVDPHERDTSY